MDWKFNIIYAVQQFLRLHFHALNPKPPESSQAEADERSADCTGDYHFRIRLNRKYFEALKRKEEF
jgi:hypothetical protein